MTDHELEAIAGTGARLLPRVSTGGWRNLPGGARIGLVVVVAVIGLNLAAAVAESALGGGEADGPVNSSYTTAPEGLAAYADLLADRGHPVERLRRPPGEADLDPATTLVMAGPAPLGSDDIAALRTFVGDGGRLVLAGGELGRLVGNLVEPAPRWARGGVREAHLLAPVPETARVTLVRSAGRGSWTEAGAALPVLGDGDSSLVIVANVGEGRVVAVADPSVLQNRQLGRADNAAFAVDLAGAAGRPVLFAEAQHGYGIVSGLGAIPTAWRWTLAGLLAAVVVAMWWRGKRLGPAEQTEVDASPPRAAHVHALAATLARTREPAPSLSRLRSAGLRRLARRAGLRTGADPGQFRAAAARAGLSPEEMDGLLGASTGQYDLVCAGRALARLEEERQ